MTGLFLQGGGGKGAFQAGVLYGLNKCGIVFNAIAGTSIGGVNGYFVLKNAFEEMKSAWLDAAFPNKNPDVSRPVVDNSDVLKVLKQVQHYSDNQSIKHFFVNYVPVKGGRLVHEWCDIKNMADEKRLTYIGYSSLLPKAIGVNPFDGHYSLVDMEEQFKTDLKDGVYDHYILDGGLLNNMFLEPFKDGLIDRLIMVVFKPDFEVPDYIRCLYPDEAICLIRPSKAFKKGDTMNFSKEFIHYHFELGFEIGQAAAITDAKGWRY